MNIEELDKLALESFHKRNIDIELLEGATETGTTIINNRNALNKIKIRNFLIHSIEPKTNTVILGKPIRTPVMNAPLSGLISHIDKNANKKIAIAAGKIGTFAFIGDPIKEEIDDIVSSTTAPVIKMIKPYKDTSKILKSIQIAEEAGCFAVGIDIDSAAGIKIKYSMIKYEPMSPKSEEDLLAIRSSTNLPFIIKGVSSIEDVIKAMDIGASAIVISNHGGRVMDHAIPTIDALKDISKWLPKNKIDLLVDGGFRHGTDVLKALALGAKGVLIGRPVMKALAIDGINGIEDYLNTITEELERVMILTGTKEPATITSDVLANIDGNLI